MKLDTHDTHMLVEVSSIGDEGGRQQHVTDNGAHLRAERLRARLPALALDHKTF